MKKNVKFLVGAAAAYFVLLFLFYRLENAAGNEGFRHFGDVIWYSVITMTTVGYGDVTPITAGGKVIGMLFALCSIGILTAVVTIGLRVLGNQLIPQLRLRRRRQRPWYVFHEENEDSSALAAAIRREDPNNVILFLSGGGQDPTPGVFRLDSRFETLLERLSGQKDVFFFFMGEDLWQNYRRGLKAAEAGFPAYAMTDADTEGIPLNLHLFAREDALSRFYWQTHPLKKNETHIVLIGCGRCGTALLERALLTNVFEAGRHTEYRVFGDSMQFQALHPEICAALAEGRSGDDVLIFSPVSWTEQREQIFQADRVILCADSDEENLNVLSDLKKWYVCPGSVHVRLAEALPDVFSFGGREEILTPEFVIRDAVNRQAVLMNDLYNASSEHPTPWNALSAFHRQSNIAAADHLLVKIRYLLDDDSLTGFTEEDCRRACERYRALYPEREELFQEMEHRRWMRFSQMCNWRYAPERDNALRLHPLLIPFDELPTEEKKKDDYAWKMLGELRF